MMNNLIWKYPIEECHLCANPSVIDRRSQNHVSNKRQLLAFTKVDSSKAGYQFQSLTFNTQYRTYGPPFPLALIIDT